MLNDTNSFSWYEYYTIRIFTICGTSSMSISSTLWLIVNSVVNIDSQLLWSCKGDIIWFFWCALHVVQRSSISSMHKTEQKRGLMSILIAVLSQSVTCSCVVNCDDICTVQRSPTVQHWCLSTTLHCYLTFSFYVLQDTLIW